jgi:hypothetical protein
MSAPGEYRGSRLRKGTRMLRMRSERRWPQQGQPERPVTDPRIPHQDREEHFCGECFGPRNGYVCFLRSERARRREAVKKAARRLLEQRQGGLT